VIVLQALVLQASALQASALQAPSSHPGGEGQDRCPVRFVPIRRDDQRN
jgi:hypothetical protein